ncbi:cell division topological specificity factor MinE [Defluviicoccus vanus]|uniref:Cell division topological specificity factor n=1 Tax=Defluviicoccus vanus TaxID=111831 RepID=A0A7H1MY58_9PROT|nr:cell division topological specificity factor MinE [Defluviicoccus vanus]QNT68394.1 cell division topological specificity factor MinE [Defluviicoccus vanus]
MNILSFFRTRPQPATATQAKERLQILLAHERADLSGPDYLPRLKTELLQVIAKYVAVDNEKIAVSLANSGNVSVLEVNIELPKGVAAANVAS